MRVSADRRRGDLERVSRWGATGEPGGVSRPSAPARRWCILSVMTYPETESGALTPAAGADASVAELARRQGVQPIRSADELVVPGMFDSDEELDDFLADLYAERRAGMA